MYMINIHIAEQDNMSKVISVKGFPSNILFPIVMIATEGIQDMTVTQKLLWSD